MTPTDFLKGVFTDCLWVKLRRLAGRRSAPAPRRPDLPVRPRHRVRPAGQGARRPRRPVHRSLRVVPGGHPGGRVGPGRPACRSRPAAPGAATTARCATATASSAPPSIRSSCCSPDRRPTCWPRPFLRRGPAGAAVTPKRRRPVGERTRSIPPGADRRTAFGATPSRGGRVASLTDHNRGYSFSHADRHHRRPPSPGPDGLGFPGQARFPRGGPAPARSRDRDPALVLGGHRRAGLARACTCPSSTAARASACPSWSWSSRSWGAPSRPGPSCRP